MHEKSTVETMTAGLDVGVTRKHPSQRDGQADAIAPREVVEGMPDMPHQEVRVL